VKKKTLKKLVLVLKIIFRSMLHTLADEKLMIFI